MFPFAAGMLGGPPPQATLVFAGAVPIVPNAIGAQVNDLAIVITPNSDFATSGGSSSWERITVGGGDVQLNWRVLTTADMTANITGAAGVPIGIYRGAKSVVSVALLNTSGSAHSATLSGVTPTSNHAGLVAVGRSFGNNSDVVGVSNPSGFVHRAAGGYYYNFHNSDPAYLTRCDLYDRLTPPSPVYAGQPFTMTWALNGGEVTLGVFELRN